MGTPASARHGSPAGHLHGHPSERPTYVSVARDRHVDGRIMDEGRSPGTRSRLCCLPLDPKERVGCLCCAGVGSRICTFESKVAI